MTTTAPPRPRGRRPGHDDTRGTIRRVAVDLFNALGYDGVSLRAIAREAQVDPALVHHYFRSKADLYSDAVLTTRLDIDAVLTSILTGPVERIGARAARACLALWECPAERDQYLTGLRRSVAAEGHSLDEFLAREVFARVAHAQGHANASLRGQLAASALMGVVLGRHLLHLPALQAASLRCLAQPLGDTLQHYLVEPW